MTHDDYVMVAAKKAWVPRWLWWLACTYDLVAWFGPLRWLLTTEVEA